MSATESGDSLQAADIEPVRFQHPRQDELRLEVMTLDELLKRVPSHHRDVHSRPDFHQVVLVESGRLDHEVDFERHRCGAGSVLHVRPGQVQRFLRAAECGGWALLFTAESLPPLTQLEAHIGPGERSAFTLKASDRSNIEATVQVLAAASASSDKTATSRAVRQHLLVALLLMLSEARESAPGERSRFPIAAMRVHERFMREIERNFASIRTAAEYAEIIGTTSKTLVRACRIVAGIAPKRLIEQRVALEGKRLLAHTTLPVAVIATDLGFSEATNFIKFFRRCEGITPALFREGFRVAHKPT